MRWSVEGNPVPGMRLYPKIDCLYISLASGFVMKTCVGLFVVASQPEISNSWQVIKLQHSKRFKAAAAVCPLRAQNWQYDLRVPFLNDGERDTVRIPILCEAVSL